MSRVSEKSTKDCAAKQTLLNSHKFNKKLFIYLSTLSLTLISFVFLVWLILRPSKPEFSIARVDIDQLNLTRPSVLNSSIQITIRSTNPNKRVGIYYEEVYAYASYQGLRITPDTSVPPFYQDNERTNVVSARLIGYRQIVGPFIDDQIQNDIQIDGRLELDCEIFGNFRWRVGNWESEKYRFNVNCVTLLAMPFGYLNSLSYIQGSECSTAV